MRVEHHVGRETLIHAVAGELCCDNEPSTRKEVLDKYKELVTYTGCDGVWKWDDSLRKEERESFLAQATEIVDRLFPDFQH